MYNPEEHERLAKEATAAPNESKEKEEKPAKTVNSEKPKVEKPKTARKRSKADKRAPPEPEPEQTEWKGKCNRYGFVRMPIGLLRTLGWMTGLGKKGRNVPVTLRIDRSADTITVKRKKV